MKILKAAFQSTTLRSAGFYSVPQNNLTSVSKLLSICFMIIGGSPASTAGGIKTTTLGVIILLIINYIKAKQNINIFNRKISTEVVNRSVVVITISIFIIIIAIGALLITENNKISISEAVYEVISAYTTVGISLGITSQLTLVGKLIIMMLMIIGRLGPVTISIALFKKNKEVKKSKMQYPQCNVLIG